MRVSALLFLILTGQFLQAQQDYSLLYLKGAYGAILEQSKALETQEDYYWNSIAQNELGKILGAIEVLHEGHAKWDSAPDLEILLGSFLYETGQYDKAAPILAKQVDEPGSFIKYVKLLEFKEEYPTAIEALQKALLKDSLNLTYLNHLGTNYQRLDSVSAAKASFRKILSINPNNQLISAKLANLLIKNREYLRAIEICDQGLASDSTNKKIIKLKGIASFNSSAFQTAINCFSYLNEQGDSGKFVFKHLGISEYKIQDYKAARLHLLKAFHADSTDTEVCFFLGKCYLNSMEPEKGLYYLDRADSLMKPDPKVLSALNIEKKSIYTTMGNYTQAMTCYQLAYAQHPKPEYLFYMASMYQNRLNDKQKALAYYEKFLSLLPPKPKEEVRAVKANEMTLYLRDVAERNIINLKEELFFNEGNH